MKKTWISLATVIFCAPGVASAAEPQGPEQKAVTTQKAGRGKGMALRFGAMVGGGVDSNVFNRKNDATTAGLGELSAKLKADLPAASWISWSSGLGLGASYRSGSGDLAASAAKVHTDVKTGLHLLVFGKKKLPGGKKVSKKKARFPVGKISLDVSYGFGANPVITETGPNGEPIEEPAPDPENEVEDVTQEIIEEADLDSAEDEDDEDDADDEDDDSDADAEESASDDSEDGDSDGDSDSEGGDFADGDSAEDGDDFIEDNALEGKSFALKGAKHKLGSNLKFTLEPRRGTAIGVKGKFSRGIVGSTREGGTSNDFNQMGTGVTVRQKILGSLLSASAGYGLDYRMFDEKTVMTPEGETETMTLAVHGVQGALTVKPIRALKFKLGYKYSQRLIGATTSSDSQKHQVRLDGQVKIAKNVAVVAETAFASSGLLESDRKDASRFQGLLGLRVKL